MEEKWLKAKNGIAVLILIILLYLASVFVFVMGCIYVESGVGVALLVAGAVWMGLGWIPAMGLRVLKPQEALVLTLFGRYIGTLKGEGFYFVNPFVAAVNPAAKTA